MSPRHLHRVALLAAITATACQPGPPDPGPAEDDVLAAPANTGASAKQEASAMTPGTAYRARGDEPSWSVEAIDSELRFQAPDAAGPVVWTDLARTDRADGFDLVATRGTERLSLAATRTVCRDRMGGMPYPQAVVVQVGEQAFTGCGGEPMDLLVANEWTVTTVGGTAMSGRAPTLVFMADGRASGFAGCNRWNADALLTGEGFGFSPAVATKMACLEGEAMAQERAFLQALPTITRHDFDEAGALLLKAGDATVIVAVPAATPAG